MQSRWSFAIFLFFIFFFLIPMSTQGAILWTDWMWFHTLTFESVFETILSTQVLLGVAGFALAAGILFANARWALGQTADRPIFLPEEISNGPIGYIIHNNPLTRLAAIISLLLGLFFGFRVATAWDEILLALHGHSFEYIEPIFNLEAGFYIFTLPLILIGKNIAMALVFLSGILALFIYLIRKAIGVRFIRQDGQYIAQGFIAESGPRRHIGFLMAIGLGLVSVGYYLQRYTLLYDQNGLFPGPGYTDIHAILPILTFQSITAMIAALALYMGVDKFSKGWTLLSALLVVLPSLVAATYPNIVQRFSVLPNELNREAPQLIHHIEATRHGFNLDGVEESNLTGEGTLSAADIEANYATINNVRLWDHEPLLNTFSQVQEIRTYYNFPSVDNDRYFVDGEYRQLMLSPRELLASNLPPQARTWINTTMTYTHGYGVAVGPVNQVTAQGLPELFVQDLPPKTLYPDDLHIERPEIYFGESMYQEVFVATDNAEFDYPEGDDNKYTAYTGTGGVSVFGVNRFLIALRQGSMDLIFSDDIREESRVLLYRSIRKRISRIAPFLRLDHDPYLAIVDGRLIWIADAYTHASQMPYSQTVLGRINYMRNSVKVTVDAYDGNVTFYNVDPSDPIIQTWNAIFPDLFTSADEMPENLRAHIRYPEDFFDIQSRLFALYHMQEPHIFYNREDEWEVPAVGGYRMQPYYTIMKLPGETQEEFILMQPFNPRNKPNLAAWMVARSDGDAYGGLRVYKFPKEKMIYGPNMIVARFNQDDKISEKLSLWNQQGSNVQMGTLLVIPIEESLIYVQPLYLSAETGSIPELKRVVVAYENEIAMEPTLEGALAKIFGSNAVANMPSAQNVIMDVAKGPEGTTSTSWKYIAQVANAHYQAALQAAQNGQWAEYGDQLDALENALAQLNHIDDTPPKEAETQGDGEEAEAE